MRRVAHQRGAAGDAGLESGATPGAPTGVDAGAPLGAPTVAAAGSVMRTRKRRRNSESPKLYSNRPATSIAVTAARPAAASVRVSRRRNRRARSRTDGDDEPRPERERRQSPLGRDLHRDIVQVGVHFVHRIRRAVLAVAPQHHFRPDTGHRMVPHHAGAHRQHRHTVAVGRVGRIEDRERAVRDGGGRHQIDDDRRDGCE